MTSEKYLPSCKAEEAAIMINLRGFSFLFMNFNPLSSQFYFVLLV